MEWARVHCLFLILPFQTTDKIPCFFTILRKLKTILKHAHNRKKKKKIEWELCCYTYTDVLHIQD